MRLSGSVKLRPVRLGFLVDPSDLGAIRRILRLCTCVWGGRYNPIIPFFEDQRPRWMRPFSDIGGLEIARGYVNFFEPDVLVETKAGVAESLGWDSRNRHFELPRVVSLGEFYEVERRGRVEFLAGLDIINVMQNLYDESYRYQQRYKPPFALIEPDPEDAFFEAYPGRYPDDDGLKYIRDAYREVFEPEESAPNADTALKLGREGFRGPLWISRYSLEESFGRGPSDETFFVFDPTVGDDIIAYWNYRLVHRRILPVSVKWLAEHAPLMREVIERGHRPIPYNPFGTKFHTNVHFGASILDERMRELAQAHLAGLPQGSFHLGRAPLLWPESTSGERWRDLKLLVSAESAPFDEETTSDGYVKVPAPAPTFHNAVRSYTRAQWMNVVVPTPSFHDDQAAIVYPSNLWNPDLHPAIDHDITVTREGWTDPQRASIGYSLLRPETGRDAIIRWLKAEGIEAHPSEEGQVAAQIMASAGSLMGCGMFADPQTLRILNGMAEGITEKMRDGRRITASHPDRARPVEFVRQHFSKRAAEKFGYWNTLDYFLERSVFRAGLRVQCPICSYYNWFDLDAITYAPTCNRCLKQFKFGQKPEDLHEVKWFYRVIGPFAAPDYARGGYAVALTLRCIARPHDAVMTWSTGLSLNELNSEIDFAGWHRRGSMTSTEEHDEPSFFVGEAKSFGKDAIDDKVVESLQKIAKRFPGMFMIVSSLRPIGQYTVDEIRRLRELAQWGRDRMFNGQPRNPLVILTATELFSDFSIEQAWKEAGGRAAQMAEPAWHDLSNLHQLAHATQSLYLGLPPFHEDYWQRLQTVRTRLLHVIRTRC